jgi:hypothetical protein
MKYIVETHCAAHRRQNKAYEIMRGLNKGDQNKDIDSFILKMTVLLQELLNMRETVGLY